MDDSTKKKYTVKQKKAYAHQILFCSRKSSAVHIIIFLSSNSSTPTLVILDTDYHSNIKSKRHHITQHREVVNKNKIKMVNSWKDKAQPLSVKHWSITQCVSQTQCVILQRLHDWRLCCVWLQQITDHPHEGPPWWKTTLIKTKRSPPWWKTTLMRAHPDERPPWW